MPLVDKIQKDMYKAMKEKEKERINALRNIIGKLKYRYIDKGDKLTEQEEIWEARGDGYFSHESMCISNTSDFDTTCWLEVLYEDLDLTPVSCQFEVKSYQSVHFRLDQLSGH